MLSPCNFTCQADDGPVKPATVANYVYTHGGGYLMCEDCADAERKHPTLRERFEPILVVEPGSEMHIALDHAFMTLAGVL